MNSYFLGIDGGGSHCRARLENASGELLGVGHAGPANVATSPATAKTNIALATDEALSAAHLSNHPEQVYAVLGLAGYNLPAGKITMESWHSPFADTLITTDMHIACVGAHAGQDGAIIIVGTGSSAIRCRGDQQQALGGYGFPIGDQASGAWLGLSAVQQCLLLCDQLIANEPFQQAILKAADANNAMDLAEIFYAAKPAEFARLAPTVMELAEAQNPVALSLVTQATEYLQQLVEQLSQNNTTNIAVVGGLANSLTDYLPKAIKNRLCPAQLTPLQGAALLARQKFATLGA